jgi:hypothetical protein
MNEPATDSVLRTGASTGAKDIAKAKSETGQVIHVKVNQTEQEISAHKQHVSSEMEEYLKKKPLKAKAKQESADEACIKK